ncbi:LacI family DNA-binding transcriptional regulator [Marinilabiliaceae bacterium ANBcel2]|nr:LacI family DNA-binding transcriptional regulator [Marinilabiliaceae bacterium ANBcel2]
MAKEYSDNRSRFKPTRIKDIAAKAGVSVGTVDRVIHNRGRVSDTVHKRVVKILEEMNYEPNVLARALVSSNKYNIAALIPDPRYDNYWEAPKQGVEMAEKELGQYGVDINEYLFNPFDAESFKRAAEKVTATKVSGILTAPIFYRESLSFQSRWRRQDIPFSLFNTHIPDYEPLVYVGQDSYQSGVLAAKLLHICKKAGGTFIIAHIDEDYQNSSHLIKKEQGFVDFFEEHKLVSYNTVHAELSNCDNKRIFYKQIKTLFDSYKDISGFFVTTSRAHTIANFLRDNCYKNILLVGYDLINQNIEHLDSGYVDFIINQNPKGQGYWGVYLLAEHLMFQNDVKPIKYLPLDIITRENMHYYISSEVKSSDFLRMPV